MADGFLNRWSRRKAGAKLGPEKKLEDEPSQHLIKNTESKNTESISQPIDSEQPPSPLTIEDVEKLDRFAPDFSAFMKPGVDPLVQQAAMKKMFSDPHFNIMDGLDIYIDDYSKPDPIPLEMLKRMVQSDMLNIFRKDEDQSGGKDTTNLADSSDRLPEQALSLKDKADLTSTKLIADDGGVNPDPMPVDKKTS